MTVVENGIYITRKGMKYLLIILFNIFAASSSLASNRLIISNDYNNDFPCSLKLNKEKKSALFIFDLNLDKKSIIIWNKKEIETNHLEHSWLVHIEGSNIDIGFYYFKHKGKKIKGTYNELFNMGQVSIFKSGNIVLGYDEPNQSTIQLIDGKVVLEINYFKTYNAFFEHDYKSANFWVLGSTMNSRRCKMVRPPIN